jgi:hypothetical protein
MLCILGLMFNPNSYSQEISKYIKITIDPGEYRGFLLLVIQYHHLTSHFKKGI